MEPIKTNSVTRPNLEINTTVRNQAKDSCCIAFATLSAAYAYFNPSQLPAFVAGVVFAVSIASIANRYFGTNPAQEEAARLPQQNKLGEARPFFLGPHISQTFAEKINQECKKLTEELPPANYCFDAWGAVRKTLDYKDLSNTLQSQQGYNRTLPTFFIVFRSSDLEIVTPDGDSVDAHYNEGVHCKAFFNIDNKEHKVVRGHGFDENKAKLEQSYKKFTA